MLLGVANSTSLYGGRFLREDLFIIFILIFLAVNHIMSLKQTYLVLVHFLECLLLFLNDSVDEECE